MLSEIKIFSNIQGLQHFYHMEMFFEIILKWSNPGMCNVFCKVQYIKYFGFVGHISPLLHIFLCYIKKHS